MYLVIMYVLLYFIVLYCHQHEEILTVCSCHVTYAFQSESTFSCLNIKELLAQKRCKICSLAKWLSVCLRTKWL